MLKGPPIGHKRQDQEADYFLMVHSQATIKFAQTIKEIAKTEEGRKLIRENAGTIVLAGPAITPSTARELKNIIGEDKVKVLVNEKDIVRYISFNPVTTIKEEGHALKNYNINFIYDEKEKAYKRPEDIKVPDTETKITGRVEKINGEYTKSIVRRGLNRIGKILSKFERVETNNKQKEVKRND